MRAALLAAKIVAYAQGFDQTVAGSEENGWDIDPGRMATIWRGGCIIRAKFLDRIRQAYDAEPDLTTLPTQEYFADAVKGRRRCLAPGGQRRDGRRGGGAGTGHVAVLLRRTAQ